MPEGDTLHRAAQRLQVLVGQKVGVETPHPRAAVKQLAERLDGLTLESVEASGKNLLLRFEGGRVLRSHLHMSGRWRVVPRGAKRAGRPWLVLRGAEHEAVLWNGPVLELVTSCYLLPSAPDILDGEPDYDAMVERLRMQPEREIGDTLLDQRAVGGIGNIWRSEALWETRVSPWSHVRDVEVRPILEAAHRLMGASVDGARPLYRVYRRAGRPCRRCGTPIRSHAQGDAARIAYWCPTCQRGGAEPRS